MTNQPFCTEPKQVDLEEYIAEKTGQPRPTTSPFPEVDTAYMTIATMYQPLHEVLRSAYQQAASGKGRDRHANGKPFLDQPIMEIGRMVGMGYQTGQAMKKAQEAGGMVTRGQHDAARAELLGAINYLAAAYILIGEMVAKQAVDSGSNKAV